MRSGVLGMRGAREQGVKNWRPGVGEGTESGMVSKMIRKEREQE